MSANVHPVTSGELAGHAPTAFRDWIRDEPDARFRAQAGRYHLYVMYGCPWAHRTIIVRALKGLEQVVGMTAVHHRLPESGGWVFSATGPDPINGVQRLQDLYRMADPRFDGRVTVPVLWDRHERTIVNNESSEIIRMFNSAFDAYAARPALDLYPEALRADIDRWNEYVFTSINEGAYRVGFATTQDAYERALDVFFRAMDSIETHLETCRFLVGEQPTEADWRLFPTLMRFDSVYYGLFKCNLRRLVDYRNLFSYARRLYQWPGVAATVDEHQIRDGYWGSMTRLNPSGIIPVGPRIDFGASAQSAVVSADPVWQCNPGVCR